MEKKEKKKNRTAHQKYSLERRADALAGQRDASQPRCSVVWCWRREEFGRFELSLASVLVYSRQGLLLSFIQDWENKRR